MNNFRGKFISIEGMDGSGKSSCANNISLTRHFNNLSEKPIMLEEVFKVAKAKKANESTIHSLYLFSLYERSNQIKKLLESGSNVIVGRWIATEMASHKLYCVLSGREDMGLDYNLFPFIKPDYSILLTASAEIRKSRMIARGELARNDKVSLHDDAEKILINCVADTYDNYEVISTDLLSEGEVQKQVLTALDMRL